MHLAMVDGIRTAYEVTGTGPPLLMYSPGGFNATASSWNELGIYRRLRLIERLSGSLTCIAFDKRETGASGGRFERVTWNHYARQGLGLLDHLGFEQAFLIGGCIGATVSVNAGLAAAERVRGMILYSPAGGGKYRLSQHRRFTRHLSFVEERGLDGVVAYCRTTAEPFNKDPKVGPWASVIRTDADFADHYAALDVDRYQLTVSAMGRRLFDHASVPGVEVEDLLTLDVPALVVPGDDDSHAPSAAHFLSECLPNAQLWDQPVIEQTAETAADRILDFVADLAP